MAYLFGYWRPRVRVPPLRPKKEQIALAVICSFFVVALRLELVLRSKMRVRISRSKIEELVLQAQSADIFAYGENPATKLSFLLRGSPTARKYSLLFGGAYAPNDAIYRKRYAFTDALIKLLVLLGRITKNSSQLFYHLLTRRFDQKATKKATSY